MRSERTKNIERELKPMASKIEAQKRRAMLNDLLSNTFNSILRVEEKALDNKLTEGLTITEVHTMIAVGLYESNPMSTVAIRLGVTLATLTTAINKLVRKGFIVRERDSEDRRKVLIRLTKRGRQVYRVHHMFHNKMLSEALADLSDQEEQVLSSSLEKVKAFFDKNVDEKRL